MPCTGTKPPRPHPFQSRDPSPRHAPSGLRKPLPRNHGPPALSPSVRPLPRIPLVPGRGPGWRDPSWGTRRYCTRSSTILPPSAGVVLGNHWRRVGNAVVSPNSGMCREVRKGPCKRCLLTTTFNAKLFCARSRPRKHWKHHALAVVSPPSSLPLVGHVHRTMLTIRPSPRACDFWNG